MDNAESYLRRNTGAETRRPGQALPGQEQTVGASPHDRRGPNFGNPDRERQKAQSKALRGGY